MNRALALLVPTLLVAVVATAAAPAPALADNCQPEELVVRMVPGMGTFQSPVADNDDPRCYVAAGLDCQNQADTVNCANGIAAALLRAADSRHPEYILRCERDTSGLPEPRRSVEFALCVVLEDGYTTGTDASQK